MKKKYFLRGLGTGIVFSAVIMMTVSSGKDTITDAEVKKRALQLGMVEKQDVLDHAIEKEKATPEATTEATTDVATDEKETITEKPGKTEKIENTEEPKTTVIKSTEKPVITEKPKVEVKSTPEVGVTEKPKATKKPVSTSSSNNSGTVSVEIKPGMWSDEIAKTFYDLDVVDDAEAFDDYLCDNNYASDIKVGKYKIQKNSTYEDVAKIITK